MPTLKSKPYKSRRERLNTHSRNAKIISIAAIIVLAITAYRNWDYIVIEVKSWIY